MFGVTTVVGPLLGGFFTDHLAWRWAFLDQCPDRCGCARRRDDRDSATQPATARDRLCGHRAGGSRHRRALTLTHELGGTTYPWGSPTSWALFAGDRWRSCLLFVVVWNSPGGPTHPSDRLFAVVFTVVPSLSFRRWVRDARRDDLPADIHAVRGWRVCDSIGLRTLPMVVGLLATSLSSGAIVGPCTGRYKVFPVLGSAVMAIAFVLLSRMNAENLLLVQSLYLLILGCGIGLACRCSS